MSTEIVINVTAGETRAALLEEGLLQEVHIERRARDGLVGNIYRGRVVRVLPGMQAAFVDIGEERTAFLHMDDIATVLAGETDIRRLVSEGDELLVQVARDPLGDKGARLSTRVTLPGRLLVLLPEQPGISISGRIDMDAERDRLRGTAEQLLSGSRHGCILRTAAEGADADALQADLNAITTAWESIAANFASTSGVRLLHTDYPLAVRVVRDLANADVGKILIDSPAVLAEVTTFMADLMPGLAVIPELYQGDHPVFDSMQIEAEIDRALDDRVELKSGGYLIIEQTEAMTTVDVNTGGFVGRSNQAETILKTNLEATRVLARQLRLRNLGGIVIIDFIDMRNESHRQQVLDALGAALKKDSARTQLTHFSPLGLVEMTRKRTRASLEHLLCADCPTCSGQGRVKSPVTVCHEIYREVLRQHSRLPVGDLVLLAHDDVIALLLDEESRVLAELETLTGRKLSLRAESFAVADEFDVVPG